MPLLLLLLFVVVPIAELYVIIQVGQAIGVLPTIGLLILDSVLGTLLLKTQGRQAWRRFNAAVAEGRIPGREVMDGALIIFGGAFLLAPGFLTDILGVLLLLPPTRAVVRRMLVRGTLGRIGFGVATPGSSPFGGPRPPRPDDPVEGTARDVDPRHLT